MAMLSRINQLIKDDSQFIIATHSPILMAYPDALLLQIENDQLVSTKYEETEHYQITKDFLNDHQRIVKYLIDDR